VSDERKKFKRESAESRQEALILATLELVAEHGVRGATVRGIAERADVTQGLIRHYFSSKEELIIAAYEHHMNQMTDLTFAPGAAKGTARARLRAFVDGSLTPPVVDPRSLALWASFLNKVQNDPQMKETHERTYAYFRDQLEEVIAAAYDEAGIPAPAARVRQLAIACNAVIDGLWLEGGALPDAFAPGELVEIGRQSVAAILGLDLEQEAEKP